MEKNPEKQGWLARWIKRLADASDQEWGGKPPQCCAGMRHKIELVGNKSKKKRHDSE